MSAKTKTKMKEKNILLDDLHIIQNKFGYIPESEILKLSKKHNKSMAQIYDEASFYSNFYFSKTPAKIIRFCQSPTCHHFKSEELLKYAGELLNLKINEQNSKCRLETCQCLALCDKGPNMMINNSIYSKLTKDKIKYIFKIQGFI